MKRIIVALFLLYAGQDILSAGTRNLIMLIDSSQETIADVFNSKTYSFDTTESLGPVTLTFLAALHQKAAPIIVSSSTWHNSIARGKIFADVVAGRDVSYLAQYPMFSSGQNIPVFVADLLRYYDAGADVMRFNEAMDADFYYTFYQTFYSKNPVFKPNEWIIKKLSEYLYLLIPHAYIQTIRQRNDTPGIARQTSTSLTLEERLLGLKVGKFADIQASQLLDPSAQVVDIKHEQYKQLVPQKAYDIIGKLRSFFKKAHKKAQEMLSEYIFGAHVLHVLSQLFVTHTDLKAPEGNQEETDLNEAYFLHEWLIYLLGHGTESIAGPVMPVVYAKDTGMRASIAFTAGLEQGAFRDLLGFLNNRVHTGAFVYTSCYSGGPHLFKLFEHHWDYPKTQKVGEKIQVTRFEQAVPDVFNYLIVATNMFYTETLGGPFFPYIERLPEEVLKFGNFFNGMAQFLHPQPRVVGNKNGSKKQKVAVQLPFVECLMLRLYFVAELILR